MQIAALYYSYVESYVEAKCIPLGVEDNIISASANAANNKDIAPPSLSPSYLRGDASHTSSRAWSLSPLRWPSSSQQ